MTLKLYDMNPVYSISGFACINLDNLLWVSELKIEYRKHPRGFKDWTVNKRINAISSMLRFSGTDQLLHIEWTNRDGGEAVSDQGMEDFAKQKHSNLIEAWEAWNRFKYQTT